MRKIVYDNWNMIMNADVNPLRHIPDTNVRHMVLQVLAWMWCIVFSMYVGSFWVMGASMIAHAIVLGAIVVTVATFETARRNPQAFVLKKNYHTPSRARTLYIDGKKYVDPYGGEHE